MLKISSFPEIPIQCWKDVMNIYIYLLSANETSTSSTSNFHKEFGKKAKTMASYMEPCVSLPIEKKVLDELVDKAKDWAVMHGKLTNYI